MAIDTNGSAKVGQGFLDKSGKLKSKDALAREDLTASSKKTQNTESFEPAPSIDGALRKVRTKFNEDVSATSSTLNQQEDNLKAAKKLVKEEISTAQDLKEAIKSGDSNKAEKSRERLIELEKDRNALSKKISSDNKSAREQSGVVALGSNVKGRVEIDQVEFSSSRPEAGAPIQSKEDAQALVESLKNELEGIDSQSNAVKQNKDELKELAGSARQELNAIQEQSLNSIEQAQGSADKIASAVRQAGSQAVLAQNLNSAVVQSLLR